MHLLCVAAHISLLSIQEIEAKGLRRWSQPDCLMRSCLKDKEDHTTATTKHVSLTTRGIHRRVIISYGNALCTKSFVIAKEIKYNVWLSKTQYFAWAIQM